MGQGHGHKLHFHGHSPIHRAAPEHKLLALLGFVLVVVATPRDWFAAYGVYLLVLAVAVVVSTVPPTYLLKRLVVEIPFAGMSKSLTEEQIAAFATEVRPALERAASGTAAVS